MDYSDYRFFLPLEHLPIILHDATALPDCVRFSQTGQLVKNW